MVPTFAFMVLAVIGWLMMAQRWKKGRLVQTPNHSKTEECAEKLALAPTAKTTKEGKLV